MNNYFYLNPIINFFDNKSFSMNDYKFLLRVRDVLRTADTREYAREALDEYEHFKDVVEEFCENWYTNHRHGNEDMYDSTVEGDYVSCWITQYSGEPLFNCTVMSELRKLQFNRDSKTIDHFSIFPRKLLSIHRNAKEENNEAKQ